MLRERQARAQEFGARHLCAVRDTNSMLYWLAEAAATARRESGRLQVHVAASASVNQSTIDRFETHTAWPRDADRVINAYADDLDVAPLELWEQAVHMWREHVSRPADERAAAAVERPAARIPARRPAARTGQGGDQADSPGR